MALVYKPLSRPQRVWLALGVAAGIHAVVLPLVARDATFKLVAPPRRASVSLVPWSSSSNKAAQDHNALSSNASKPKTEAEKKKEEEEKAQQVKVNGQIVDIGAPQDQRAPVEPTRYLSEFDSRVLKETRARQTSAFYKNALSKEQKEGKQERVDKQTARSAATEQPALGNSPVEGKEGGGLVEAAHEASTPTRQRQDRISLEKTADGRVRDRVASEGLVGSGKKLAMAEPAKKSQIEGRGEGAPGGVKGAPTGAGQPLKLQLDNPLETLGPIAGGPMPDHLPDVEEGDGTYLNTRAFIGASYFNRVKETVARIWTPDVEDAQRSRDPTGQVYAYKDRYTVVNYTINRNGDVIAVVVTKPSGVQFLDDVAVNAFKKAERIPNPPQAILGPDGTATTSFGFFISSAQGGPAVRMGPAYMPGSPAARGW